MEDDIRLVEGTLIGATDGLTLQLEDGSVQAMRSYGNIRFPELPGGLITRPTLEWLLDSPVAGPQSTRIAYETSGMTWWADYTIVYDESTSCTMDLSAWVTIINQSGAGYEDARLKLIAGDVNRAERHAPAKRNVVYRMAMEEMAPAGERLFVWLHLYDPHDPYEPPEPFASRYPERPYAGEVAWTNALRIAGARLPGKIVLGWAVNLIAGTRIADINCGFRAARRDELLDRVGLSDRAGDAVGHPVRESSSWPHTSIGSAPRPP